MNVGIEDIKKATSEFVQDEYSIYLRKSRKDADLEAKGEGETLKRHEQILLDLAKRQGLKIGHIYKEVVSGDSIEARPEMQKLLADVHGNRWKGVLVVELERLARGDTKDQGIVAEAFKYSETLIVTPAKTYNPNNEFDEEYFEFGLFMSRREYKTIKRRLQAGVKLSVLEGNYLAPVAPYGYDIVDRGRRDRTLKPNEKAPIVKMMFEWYAYEKIGFCGVARRLTDMGIPSPKGYDQWTFHSVTKILKNDIYIGKVRHGKNKDVKEFDPETGKLKTVCRQQNDNDITIADGKHPAIIDMELWEATVARHSKNVRVSQNRELSNALAGILHCSQCGLMMNYKKTERPTKKYEWIRHRTDTVKKCKCESSDYHDVMNAIAKALSEYISDFEIKLSGPEGTEEQRHNDMIHEMEKNLEAMKAKRKKLMRFFEDEIYTEEEFLERKKDINDEMTMLSARIQEARATTPDIIDYEEKILKFSQALNAINDPSSTPKEINDFLKAIICKIDYTKESKIEPFKLKITLL